VIADGAQLEQILAPISAWARSRSNVHGLALVGSWARGSARRDSDIDLMLLVPEPRTFRSDEHWLAEIDWADGRAAGWHDAEYGSAWSRHVELEPHCKIEFTFSTPRWAATDPIDAGTAKVVSDGCRILVDKTHLFGNLLTAVSP
jgi:predicted nucleotidyltransferase